MRTGTITTLDRQCEEPSDDGRRQHATVVDTFFLCLQWIALKVTHEVIRTAQHPICPRVHEKWVGKKSLAVGSASPIRITKTGS